MLRGKLLLIMLLSISWCEAQWEVPRVSPRTLLQQDIGLTSITIDYSRPSARGRKVMGELVPYGRIWRVGANESTKMTISDTVWVMDHPLPPGTYALYAIPDRERWEVIVHDNTEHWGDGRTAYDPAEDRFRESLMPERLPFHQESFVITFDSLSHNHAVMQWRWEGTQISIPIRTNTQSQMLRSIEKVMSADPEGQTYYEAARFLQEQRLQPEQALEWLEKAQEKVGETYYIHRVRALVLAQLARYEEAIESAKRSKAMAHELGKDEFVRMNERSIAEWSRRQ
ncbi:DUF2911 domain-containing protein [Croceiramulus getboli]|nr:DUF2911 domain-containing protein [Flavobacteriaceae bacterium YJPT1-3]